jgi:hypothetical protein
MTYKRLQISDKIDLDDDDNIGYVLILSDVSAGTLTILSKVKFS